MTRQESHRLTQWDGHRHVSESTRGSDDVTAPSRDVSAGFAAEPGAPIRQTFSDYDISDPMLAVLLDVQRGRIGALTALYRVRALVAGGWR